MKVGSIAAVLCLALLLATKTSTAGGTIQPDDGDSCCLCNSCQAVPSAKNEVILLHNNRHLGNTCGELDWTLRDNRELDLNECATLKRDYEIVCCTIGFDGIDVFDVQELYRNQRGDTTTNDGTERDTWFASYVRAARELWQTSATSWKPQTATMSIQVPSSEKEKRHTSRQPSITHSVTNSSADNRGSSWGSSLGTSYFFTDSSDRPSVRVRTETRVVPSTNSSNTINNNHNSNRSWNRTDSGSDSTNRSRSSTWQRNTDRSNNTNDISNNRTAASRSNRSHSSTDRNGNSSDRSSSRSSNTNNGTGSNRNNNRSSNTPTGDSAERSASSRPDRSGAMKCTNEPVGVRFQTRGGNYGFGVCRDGSKPTSMEQGATIWDPNENKIFEGDCRMIDQLSK